MVLKSNAKKNSRHDHAAALEKVMQEYAQVVKDFDATRAQLSQAQLEVSALRTKVRDILPW